MSTLLIQNARTLATMNDAGDEIVDGALFIRDNVIEWIGATGDLPPEFSEAEQTLDARDRVVLPGLVNTHHHFYQTLTRAIPGARDQVLFDWLQTLYPIWAGLTPEMVRASTQIALTELLLSGCTTSSDHHYLWPNGSRLDDQFEAASEIGLRFHGARGSMSLSEKDGGLPPDSVVQDEATILRDCRRVVEEFHDPSCYAMRRVVIAPCSPFSVTPELMRESADLARSFGAEMNVHLHTHLAETQDEEAFCLERFGQRPVDLIESLGWTGDDVWHAHCVHVSDEDIALFARTRTGAAHCPTSNMLLASGVAPGRKMLDANVPLGLGVDGSASNDGNHLLGEVRQAMLLQRVGTMDPTSLKAREALRVATRGGAEVLGRDDIGQLAPGMAADVVAWRVDDLAHAGASVHDPVAALVYCQPTNVDFAVVNGRLLVRDGQPTLLDVPRLVEAHNAATHKLLSRAGVM